MGKKDFSDLEDQIRDTINNAFNAIDIARIKKDISGKTENNLNEVKSKLKDKSQYFNEKMGRKIQKQYNNVTKKAKNDEPIYISKRPVGSMSGILYTILGVTFSGILGVLLIIYPMIISLLSGFLTFSYVSLGVLFSFFGASMVLALRGTYLRKRVKRFKQYVKCLNGKTYCSIEDLASTIRKKNKFVVKDLRKMTDLGMFTEAHIDDKKTCFMLSNEVYQNYLNSQEALKERNEDELKRKAQSDEKTNDPKNEELIRTIRMVENYIEQIEAANDAISGEEISNKLYRLQNIVSQIISYVGKNPKKLPEVNKFTNHYLPITLKLVNSYKELNDQPVQGDNIKSAKNQIEKSIDVINIAFEKLLDDLFEEIALDISTDISVLETLFTQEGLTKNDFEK